MVISRRTVLASSICFQLQCSPFFAFTSTYDVDDFQLEGCGEDFVYGAQGTLFPILWMIVSLWYR